MLFFFPVFLLDDIQFDGLIDPKCGSLFNQTPFTMLSPRYSFMFLVIILTEKIQRNIMLVQAVCFTGSKFFFKKMLL